MVVPYKKICGWDIAYKRLGPPGTIHVDGYLREPRCQGIGIFASGTYGISGDHPQELLQEHQDVITLEYPHRPCVIISDDLHYVFDDRIETQSWMGSGVLQGCTGLRYNAFLSQSASHRTSFDQHDDVIKWKHFPRNWPFVRGIHRSRWIPRTKASDAELWCFLWSASE